MCRRVVDARRVWFLDQTTVTALAVGDLPGVTLPATTAMSLHTSDRENQAQAASIRTADIPVIGLVGGVASGKSVVAAELARLGAAVLDADRAGHEVLELPAVVAEIRQRWGGQVFDDTGRIDRRAVGRIVFDPTPIGKAELAFLEQLTHPRIGELLMAQVAGLAEKGARALVLDAPVMEKSGWYGLCDRIIFVDAPREIRLARARERGWTEEEFVAREGAQESLEQKRGRADLIVDNSGSLPETRAQIERWWQSLFPR